jgi:hypothetical protein
MVLKFDEENKPIMWQFSRITFNYHFGFFHVTLTLARKFALGFGGDNDGPVKMRGRQDTQSSSTNFVTLLGN